MFIRHAYGQPTWDGDECRCHDGGCRSCGGSMTADDAEAGDGTCDGCWRSQQNAQADIDAEFDRLNAEAATRQNEPELATVGGEFSW